MNNILKLEKATGKWSANITTTDENNFVATKIYATLYGSSLNLQGSHWPDGNGADINVTLKDRILGNGKPDLLPNGLYTYPNKDITIDYHGTKNGVNFDATPVLGAFTIDNDHDAKLYKGWFIIKFSLDGKSFYMDCTYEVSM